MHRETWTPTEKCCLLQQAKSVNIYEAVRFQSRYMISQGQVKVVFVKPIQNRYIYIIRND